MKIKAGMRFLCTRDVVMNNGFFSYKEGRTYLSEGDGCITDEEGDASHVWLDEYDEYTDSEDTDSPEDYFTPLQEVEYVWTEATPELKKLFENYKGKREGQRKDMSKVHYFSNKSVNPQDTAFTAYESFDPPLYYKSYYMTPDTFIEHLGLRDDSEKQTQKRLLEKMMSADEDSGIYEERREEVFNPKSYYDNSKGSLYKVATERGWNAYLFDLVKRLERGGKKDPLRQEIEKSIDVLKIWLNELPE